MSPQRTEHITRPATIHNNESILSYLLISSQGEEWAFDREHNDLRSNLIYCGENERQARAKAKLLGLNCDHVQNAMFDSCKVTRVAGNQRNGLEITRRSGWANSGSSARFDVWKRTVDEVKKIYIFKMGMQDINT